ncbi:hypothetical protein [Aureispira anguillae]|uniref:Lipoprotein n=1 Tax=Aureispira anguillae TaxID=2864201 RepID=A0A915YCQ1_9BACT|nr:hypothetical protein [Aureispira anguillae]BDS10654.1 hypothetical protein AsAng_0013630 [Aureispira anguillae]
MNFKLAYLLLLVASLTMSCEDTGKEANTNETKDAKTLSVEDQLIVDNVMKEEVVTTEPQAIFDQSQLSNAILGLCVKFKTLDGADRKAVFDKFETILPSCPAELKDNNEIEVDADAAVQVMSYNDLREFLGEPNEIREDGTLVYNLLADESYKVIFMQNAAGAISCRFYEGAS